jgi:biopolymer transport protein ExbB/biopolymer transport protein TolQ
MEPLVWWTVVLLWSMLLWSWIVIADRITGYHRARLQSKKFLRDVQNGFLDNQWDEIMRVSEKRSGSHLAKVVRAGAQAVCLRSDSAALSDFSKSLDVRMSVQERKVDRELRRGMGVLANVAATAPFVGLFGTTIGILDSFRAVDMAHSAVISMIAGTIAEALAPSALGIVVAIPAAWGLNYLNDRFEILRIEMSLVRSEMLTYAQRTAREPLNRR